MSDLDRGPLPPGAEFAPLVPIGVRPSTLGDWEQVERRLSVRDPDDQRAIWRRAAMALGAPLRRALYATLSWRWTPQTGLLWHLSIDPECEPLVSVAVDTDDHAIATAALCARVWGPR